MCCKRILDRSKAKLAKIQPKKHQNVLKTHFSQKVPGVNGLNRLGYLTGRYLTCWVVHPHGFTEQKHCVFAVVSQRKCRSISCCKMKPCNNSLETSISIVCLFTFQTPPWHSQVESFERKDKLITNRHTVQSGELPSSIVNPRFQDSTGHII